MFGKTKNYILNTANIVDTDLDKVGKEAAAAAALATSGVVAASSIVLTTEAFDDFITAADISEKISAAVATVQADNAQSAKKAADAITSLIEQASFPSLILNPLIQAYKSLSGFSDKYVTVEPSWVLPRSLLPTSDCPRLSVKGEPALLYAIKQCWACLFSPEALLQRKDLNYQGALSMAVVIEKVVQAEISGKAFTHDPITSDPAITIEAILGLEAGITSPELMPDVYRVDSGDMRIREKNIMSQEYMFLRKGRAKPEEDPNMKVAISPEWRRRQKLPDHSIIELAQIVHGLGQRYGYPVELRWAYETGQLIITGLQELKSNLKPEVDVQSQLDKAIHADDQIEIVPTAPILPPEGKFAMKQVERPDIKSLAAEVEDMVNNQLVSETLMPELAIDAEPIATEDVPLVIDQKVLEHIDAEAKDLRGDLDLLTNIYLDISDMSSEKLASASTFDGVYLDGTMMVLRHKVLAETIAKQKPELSRLIESYALEISTAAKVVEPRPLYYSFSDIGNVERTALGVETRGLDGSERFLSAPEAMIAEILAVKRARSTYNAKNVKLILPKLRNEAELSDVKKILSSQNIRRSSVVQLFAEIALPSFVYELLEVSNHELDGVMINFAKLGQAITGRWELSERDYMPVLSAIRFMLDQNAAKRFATVLKIPPKRELVQDVMSLNVSSFIFTEVPDQSLLELIKSMESNQLKPAPVRRGRKPKSL